MWGVCWVSDASPFPPDVAPLINDCVHGPARPQAGSAFPRAFVSFLGFRGPGRGCFSQESSLSPAAAKCRPMSTGNTDRCDSHDFSGASAYLSAPLCTRIQTFLITPTCVASCRHTDPLTCITPHVGPIRQALATHRCLWTFVDLPHSNPPHLLDSHPNSQHKSCTSRRFLVGAGLGITRCPRGSKCKFRRQVTLKLLQDPLVSHEINSQGCN